MAEVTINGEFVQGLLKEPLPSGRTMFYTVRVDPQLSDRLIAHGVVVNGGTSGYSNALDRGRVAGSFGGHDEKERALNQLLSELDGFDPSTGVILLAPPIDLKFSARRCSGRAALAGKCLSTAPIPRGAWKY